MSPFVLEGRLPRRAFWLGALTLTLAFAALFVLLEKTLGHGATWLLYPPFYWIAFSLAARRLHDRNKSAFWLLLLLVPVLGPLWLAIELPFLRGNAVPNAYGHRP